MTIQFAPTSSLARSSALLMALLFGLAGPRVHAQTCSDDVTLSSPLQVDAFNGTFTIDNNDALTSPLGLSNLTSVGNTVSMPSGLSMVRAKGEDFTATRPVVLHVPVNTLQALSHARQTL